MASIKSSDNNRFAEIKLYVFLIPNNVNAAINVLITTEAKP